MQKAYESNGDGAYEREPSPFTRPKFYLNSVKTTMAHAASLSSSPHAEGKPPHKHDKVIQSCARIRERMNGMVAALEPAVKRSGNRWIAMRPDEIGQFRALLEEEKALAPKIARLEQLTGRSFGRTRDVFATRELPPSASPERRKQQEIVRARFSAHSDERNGAVPHKPAVWFDHAVNPKANGHAGEDGEYDEGFGDGTIDA